MKFLAVALVALSALAGVATLAPTANAQPPLCHPTTVGVGTLEVVTIYSGSECGSTIAVVYTCTPKYGEAAPLHFVCTGTPL